MKIAVDEDFIKLVATALVHGEAVMRDINDQSSGWYYHNKSTLEKLRQAMRTLTESVP